MTKIMDIKSLLIGFLLALVLFLSLGFTDTQLGSVSWKPMYVKIVE